VSRVQQYIAIPLCPNNSHRVGQLAIPLPAQKLIAIIEQTLIERADRRELYPVHSYVYSFSESSLAGTLGLAPTTDLRLLVRELRHRAIKDTEALLALLTDRAEAVELDEYHSDLDATEWEDVELMTCTTV
jgi:hypothetical protein